MELEKKSTEWPILAFWNQEIKIEDVEILKAMESENESKVTQLGFFWNQEGNIEEASSKPLESFDAQLLLDSVHAQMNEKLISIQPDQLQNLISTVQTTVDPAQSFDAVKTLVSHSVHKIDRVEENKHKLNELQRHLEAARRFLDETTRQFDAVQ